MEYHKQVCGHALKYDHHNEAIDKFTVKEYRYFC